MLTIRKAAVLGAGTMGSRIAGHLANAGLEVILLDLSTDLARQAIAALATTRPPALFDDDLAARITPGSFAADLHLVEDCDWIIEAVSEDLAIKRSLISQVNNNTRVNSIVTTNTSGLSVAAIAETMPPDFHKRWFGVHFFNPPRYMRLVEIIPTAESDPELVSVIRTFATERLGKTVVTAKDTPNFIANRIGLFALLNAMQIMQDLDLSIEDVDALTGSAIGWPNTATFRLMDLIGLDVIAHMDRNFRSRTHDERPDLMLPQFLQEMVSRQWLGNKSGQGFYRKDPDAVLDWRTLEYREPRSVAFAEAREHPFHRRFLPGLWAYARNRIPEIAEDQASIDTAMREGFNWQQGPFEMHDASASKTVPQYPIIRSTPSISLHDLGDGVAQFEFHTKMNAIDETILAFLTETLAASEFRAYVLYNDTPNFSAGANLADLLSWIEVRNWAAIHRFLRLFQAATQAVKLSPRPVVAAPAGLCLGGGAEIVLHAAACQCHAELSIGMVEARVGLIPAGGGCKELALRVNERRATWQQVFTTLTSAERSRSALHARKLHLLSDKDGITMSRHLLLSDAVKRIPHAYTAPPINRSIAPCGEPLETAQANPTEYDCHIADKLGYVLRTGLTEQHSLDLEREVFLSLCGEPRTAARIAHTLKTGKPLRN